MLCAITVIIICPFGIVHAFLTKIGKGYIIPRTGVSPAYLQVGSILGSNIPQHCIIPVSIEVFILLHTRQLFSIGHTTVHLDIMCREFRCQSVQIVSLIFRHGIIIGILTFRKSRKSLKTYLLGEIDLCTSGFPTLRCHDDSPIRSFHAVNSRGRRIF